MRQFLSIVLLCIAGAVCYGVVHDQVTARICIEYFTIGHHQVLPAELATPTMLGLVWGIIATWWAGLMLGVPLAVCARVGRRPRLTACDLVRPVLVGLGVLGALAAVAGLIGRTLAQRGDVWLVSRLARVVPEDRHVDFLTAGWAHTASYLGGVLLGLVLCVYAFRKRSKMHNRARLQGGAQGAEEKAGA